MALIVAGENLSCSERGGVEAVVQRAKQTGWGLRHGESEEDEGERR
jgi:hypothetical protein